MRDSATPVRPVPVGNSATPIRVLLVEDDRLDRMVIERFVLRQRLPYEVTTAESGMEALQKLRGGTFDVVLLDYMLGDMTGLELLPELRSTPGIFITGMGTEEIAADAIRLGAYGYLVKDADHAYLNILPVIIGNVMQRQRAEESLRQTQRRLAALLGNLAGVEYRSGPGPARIMLTAAGGCEDLTGFTVGELTGPEAPALESMVLEADRKRVAECLEEAQNSGIVLDCTYRLRSRGGGWKWVRDRAVMVRGDDGTCTGWEGFLADMSSQSVAEESLRQAREESQEAMKVRDRLMTLVVHDLRAPLSTLMLSVQQLRMELTDFADAHGLPQGTEPRQRFGHLFDAMTDRSQDMLRMIDQLLLSSRLRSGVLTPAKHPFGAARLRAMTDALVPLAQQKGISLKCDVPDGFRILADADLLADVIQNLLTNAIKFTPTRGTVRVLALPEGQHGFAVSDTGVGIAPERLPNLFNREQRTTTLGTAGERGTGMGLAMSQEVIEAHGGRIEVHSTLDQGSEFRVVLPQEFPQLLAVSLDDADATLLQSVVSELNGELRRASGPDEALHMAKERNPQAVIVKGSSPAALPTLKAMRADAVQRNIPLLWVGPPDPPPGMIPDESLTLPLTAAAVLSALRLSFGG